MQVAKKLLFLLCILALLALAFFYLKPKPPGTFEEYEKKAQQAISEQRFQEAINHYIDAAQAEREHERVPQVLLKVAELYQHSLGDLDQAHLAYKMVVDQFPTSFFAKKALKQDAAMMERHHRYQEALLSYQSLLEKFSQSIEAQDLRFKVALMALKLKKYGAAKGHLMELLEEDPQNPQADRWLYHLGETLFLSGDFPQALKTFELAQEKYPNSPLITEIKFSLANVAEALGQTQKALTLYQELRNLYPNPMIIEQKIQALLKEQE